MDGATQQVIRLRRPSKQEVGGYLGWPHLTFSYPEVGATAAPLWVLTHRDLRTTTRVRVLRDFVVSALRAKRALIEGKGNRTPGR